MFGESLLAFLWHKHTYIYIYTHQSATTPCRPELFKNQKTNENESLHCILFSDIFSIGEASLAMPKKKVFISSQLQGVDQGLLWISAVLADTFKIGERDTRE